VTLAIIDSGGANISSVMHALRRLGTEPVFTRDAETIGSADRVILPGVGAAGAAMARLRELGLVECIQGLQQPVLGICLGMQLLFEKSTESHLDEEKVECLGLIPGTLEKLESSEGVRVPHMGWNTTTTVKEHPLLDGLPTRPWFYFVHSYRAPVGANTVRSLPPSCTRTISTAHSFTLSAQPRMGQDSWQTFWGSDETDSGH